MTRIKKSALALCLVLLCSSYSNSQTPSSGTTGNLINYGTSPTDTTSTWNNGVYVNQLGCFGGDSNTGYCGPNPNVNRNNGAINFSYGQVNLNQIVNINTALAAGGSGVQLNGFNFSFIAKNGNGWDDGRQDYLSAYVKLNGAAGNTIANYDYTSATDRKYNWTQFNFSETFATPYTASKLSTAQVGFVGRDNNYWAGPYGPEIINVSFSMTYSVKPAAPPIVPTQPAYTPPPPPPPASPPPAEASPAFAQASPQQPPPPPPPRAGPGQDSSQNPSMAQDGPGPMQGPQQAGPAPTSPQPAGGPPQTTTASASPSAVPNQSGPAAGPSAGPSKLAMSVVKSAQEKDRATQAQTVQNAAKALEGTQQSSQASSNAAISMNQDMSANSATAAAAFAGQTTQDSVQTATSQPSQTTQQTQQTQTQTYNSSAQSQQSTNTTSIQQQESQVSTASLLKPPTPASMETQPQTSAGIGLSVSRNYFAYNPFSTNNTANTTEPAVQSAPMYQPSLASRQTETESPQIAMSSFSNQSRPGNPLNDLIQPRTELPQTTVEQRTETVKREVQPNELAGGVDIASMATQPAGFTAYSIVLKDTAFYEPKEVYKNQRTIDNARVLRGLTGGSDRLHQDMVNQQFKGN